MMATRDDWRVVLHDGRVYAENLNQAQAEEMAAMVLQNGAPGARTERASWRSQQQPQSAPKPISTPAVWTPPAPGQEREALREAIVRRADASVALNRARAASESGTRFLDDAQAEVYRQAEAHQSATKEAGALIAEAIRSGVASTVTRTVDRGRLIDAEARRDTARVAADELAAELLAAEAGDKTAESCLRLAAGVVKQQQLAALVDRLDTLQREAWKLRFQIEMSRLSDLALTPQHQYILSNPVPSELSQGEAAAHWRRFSDALRENPEATWEGAQ